MLAKDISLMYMIRKIIDILAREFFFQKLVGFS